MAVTPNTVLYLLKSPIELDNLNQLTFSNATAQYEYFSSLPKFDIYSISYQRKDNVIRFPAHIDSIMEYNYVMYQNSNYGDKWFYAFVTGMEYLNDSTTLISIKTDVYQTWMFDITVKRSFVVREHTNNDTVGNNTVPEGFETGTMIATNYTPITYLRDYVDTGADAPNKVCIVVASTLDLSSGTFSPQYGNNYQGLFSGAAYYAFPADNVEYLNNCLKAINAGSSTSIDDIVSIFMCPTELIGGPNLVLENEYTTSFGQVKNHTITNLNLDYFRTIAYTVNKPTSIDGYTPVNKKLLTGEFNSLNVTNYCGSVRSFRYEFFNGNNCKFHMRGALKPECSIYMYPSNYLHAESDTEYKDGAYTIPAPPLPICNWNSDQFTAWLASTSSSRTVERIGGIAKFVGGVALIGAGVAATVASGGSAAPAGAAAAKIGGGLMTAGAATAAGAGLAASGVGTIANSLAQEADHEKDANANAGELSSADANYTNSKVFGAYQFCIRQEYARKIDGVFSAIGYKTNQMKIPNVTGRRNWNYVQTKAVAIQGTIPQTDLQEIKNMFDNGVTFWHNPNTFLDYSQNNDII